MVQELLASGGEARASFAAYEDRSPELIFKRADARTDGRLSHVQPLGSADEAARLARKGAVPP